MEVVAGGGVLLWLEGVGGCWLVGRPAARVGGGWRGWVLAGGGWGATRLGLEGLEGGCWLEEGVLGGVGWVGRLAVEGGLARRGGWLWRGLGLGGCFGGGWRMWEGLGGGVVRVGAGERAV